MRITLKNSLNDCLVALKRMKQHRDKWVKDWPGQVHISLLFFPFVMYILLWYLHLSGILLDELTLMH